MRTVHVVTATIKPEALAQMTSASADDRAVMAKPFQSVRRTKRSADAIEADLRASGIWIVERKAMREGTLEDALMHITGLAA